MLSAIALAVVSGRAAGAAETTAAGAGGKAPAVMSFQVKPESPRPLNLASAVGFLARDVDAPEARIDGGFSVTPALAGDARILDTDRFYESAGPVSWRSNGFSRQAEPGGPIDSVRVSVAGIAPTAAFAPLTLVRPDRDGYEVRDVDVTVTRGWPSVVSLEGSRYALDVTPHAGLGFGGAGGSAEAGATLRLGKKRNMSDRVHEALGVHDGAQTFGDRGRWYIFAAASGRAVGLNMLRGQNGDWSRAGLTQDTTSKLIGDSQAGVAWRRGPMQASLGYIHRSIKAKDGIMGLATQKDDVVALSFSLKPRW
ncbi:lipid A-modifier LpxR family protein [uncultured Caulobacter sp.]|uniref:lipid A-modifier LpxR family protein n=1 Tax=uncultured Caulobacter sp. TaxID=158749 RepID=UPI00345CF89E